MFIVFLSLYLYFIIVVNNYEWIKLSSSLNMLYEEYTL